MRLNREKVKRLAYGSNEPVHYQDGTPVTRVEKVEYLGAIIHENGDPGPEIKHRAAKARRICDDLRPLWGAPGLERKDAVKVINQCALSSFQYAAHTMYLHRAWEAKVDAVQASCLRKAMRIPTTYASKKMGAVPVTNEEVRQRAGEKRLSMRMRKTRYVLLGHILRRDGGDVPKAVSFDRFGHPRTLPAKKKPGDQKFKWNREVMKEAISIIDTQGILRQVNEGKGTPESRVAALAQDRSAWKKWIERWVREQD